jgi:hypothetical protein
VFLSFEELLESKGIGRIGFNSFVFISALGALGTYVAYSHQLAFKRRTRKTKKRVLDKSQYSDLKPDLERAFEYSSDE